MLYLWAQIDNSSQIQSQVCNLPCTEANLHSFTHLPKNFKPDLVILAKNCLFQFTLTFHDSYLNASGLINKTWYNQKNSLVCNSSPFYRYDNYGSQFSVCLILPSPLNCACEKVKKYDVLFFDTANEGIKIENCSFFRAHKIQVRVVKLFGHM